MKYIISTLGCKVNQYETQAMETMLLEHGHEPAAPGDPPTARREPRRGHRCLRLLFAA